MYMMVGCIIFTINVYNTLCKTLFYCPTALWLDLGQYQRYAAVAQCRSFSGQGLYVSFQNEACMEPQNSVFKANF